MSSVRGKVCVVTGAGSGIGRELARELARRGARLALSDVDEAGLAETAALVGADAFSERLDVSDRAAVQAHAAAVVERFGVVHQVYNNAGVAGGGRTVLDSDWKTYDRVIAIDLFGVIHGTKAFLPHLIASGDGHVVNVSSLNGFFGQPSLSDYCAAKFGVRGFSEALRGELLVGRHPVLVSVVHPGGVKTNIATAALTGNEDEATARDLARVRTYNDKLLKMPADQAARTVVDGVEAGRPRILVGNDARAVDALVRLAPRLSPRLAALMEKRLFGRAA